MKVLPYFGISIILIFNACTPPQDQTSNLLQPLPSWADGPAKNSILSFIAESTNEEGEAFIPVADRIAVFDNDGTLWAEQPLYFQLAFAFDRVKALAPEHPEWDTLLPYSAVLHNDTMNVLSHGVEGLLKLIYATHANLDPADFNVQVRQWINTAQHPTKGKRYKELVYQPMLELLDLLRANNFKVFISSGGGIDFMRVWAAELYSIPTHQVIGSSLKIMYADQQIIKQPQVNHINNNEGKPVGIHQHIGKPPVFCAGNSDGDLAMMNYTAKNPHSFMLFVHHTDADREWAYDSNSAIGELNKGLIAAQQKQWTVVNMQTDWLTVFKE